jgi:pimeloyl-ACP methyl ester carboxylesterase
VVAGLVAAYDPPVLGRAVRALTGRPRVVESAVGGLPATVARPACGAGPWPAVVLLPGVTRRGRGHPAFQRIAHALASTGHLAVVPEPDGLSAGEITPESARQVAAAVHAVLERRDAAGPRIVLAGVSGGGSLALLTSADDSLAERTSLVVALAPCCDIARAARFVTTGRDELDGVDAPFVSGDFFKLVVARSLVASLQEGQGRSELRTHLLALDDHEPDPLAGVRRLSRDGPPADVRSLVELLANDDPDRFDDLFADLPEELRASIDSLSAIAAAPRISAPVELVVARRDKYVPLGDAVAFAAVCRDARLTVIETLEHAVPRLGVGEVRELAKLDRVLVRLVAAAHGTPSYSRP